MWPSAANFAVLLPRPGRSPKRSRYAALVFAGDVLALFSAVLPRIVRRALTSAAGGNCRSDSQRPPSGAAVPERQKRLISDLIRDSGAPLALLPVGTVAVSCSCGVLVSYMPLASLLQLYKQPSRAFWPCATA